MRVPNAPLDIRKTVGRVFNVSPSSISDTDSCDTIPAWDSFQSLILFQELEKEARVSFELKDLAGIRTVADIKKLLAKYKIPFI